MFFKEFEINWVQTWKKGFSNFREAFIILVRLAGIEPAHPVPETSELCFYEHSNTKMQWDASPLAGRCRVCEAIGASLRTQVRILLPFYRTGKWILSFHVKHFFIVHKKWPSREPLVRFTFFISLYFEWFGISRTFGKEEWE